MTTQRQGFTRTDSDFRSHGTRCSGWLYMPKGVASPPTVIMAHGFAAERTFRLPAFAERFVKEGIAVFLFDYRCFGESDGKPRNLVNPYRHVRDWKAAIGHIRALPNIDHGKIALWGTSYGGGHVIVAASRDPGISAVISQMPIVDSIPLFTRLGPRDMARTSIAAARDIFRMLTLRSPYLIPVLGDPGTLACITTLGAKAGYFSMIPEGSTWKNQCPARIGFTTALYRPIMTAGKVRCPVLIILGEKDLLHPRVPIEKAASIMERAELVKMPIGPFDLYAGEWFEKAVEVETSFLRQHFMVHH